MKPITCKLRIPRSFLTKALIAISLPLVSRGFSLDTLIRTKADLPKAEASVSAGDTLTLADGNWDDVEIKISKSGTPDQPILFRAQTPGLVILRNSSHVIFDGKSILMSGLLLQGASTRTGHAVEFTPNSAQCRLTETAIDTYNNSASRDDWVSVAGFQNRVDYCSFTGKKNVGIILRVARDANKSDQHIVAHNYFGARSAINGNGAEEIQIGLKETQFTESNTTVEYNLFEDCNGELENISVKSGGNILRYNTFVRCQSHLTLRHSAGSLVEGNYIDGQGASGTGGIRVCGKNHTIVNNFCTGLRGTDEYGGGVNIHGGESTDPVKDPAIHVPAQNCLVAFNTMVDNKEGIVYGGVGATPPSGLTLANNILKSGIGPLFDRIASTPFAKVEANILSGSNLGITKQAGFDIVDPLLDKTLLNGYTYYLPGVGSPALGKAAGNYQIPGWPGPLPPPNIGENMFGLTKVQPLSRSDVGPSWKGGPTVTGLVGQSELPGPGDARKHAGYPRGSVSERLWANKRFDLSGRFLPPLR